MLGPPGPILGAPGPMPCPMSEPIEFTTLPVPLGPLALLPLPGKLPGPFGTLLLP